MLFVCSNISKYAEFKELFKKQNEGLQFHDLSKIPSQKLAGESLGINQHYTNCAVFLGYLEVGWMLEPTHQTILRTLFRNMTVGFVCHYTESIPFSWKNGIDTIYTSKDLHKNGNSKSINYGGSIQDKPSI